MAIPKGCFHFFVKMFQFSQSRPILPAANTHQHPGKRPQGNFISR